MPIEISRRKLITGAAATAAMAELEWSSFGAAAATGVFVGAPSLRDWPAGVPLFSPYCGYGRQLCGMTIGIQKMLGRKAPLGMGFLGYASATNLKFTAGSAASIPYSAGSGGALGGYAAMGVPNVTVAVPLAVTGVTLDQVAAGFLDTTYSDTVGNNGVFQNIKSLYTAPYLRLGWEFNASGWPWSCDDTSGKNASSFVAAWRHVAPIAKTIIPDCKLVWNPNLGKTWVSNPEDYYPGDDVVDIIAQDTYNIASLGVDQSDPVLCWTNETWGCLGTVAQGNQQPFRMQWLFDFASRHNKRAAFPEIGTGFITGNTAVNRGDDPYYMTQICAAMKNPANNCEFFGMGDVVWGSPNGYNTRLSRTPSVTGTVSNDPYDNKPLAAAAFIAAFG